MPLNNIMRGYEFSTGNTAARSSQSLQKSNSLPLNGSLSVNVPLSSPEVMTLNKLNHSKGKKKGCTPKFFLKHFIRKQTSFNNAWIALLQFESFGPCSLKAPKLAPQYKPPFKPSRKKIQISWRFAAPNPKHLLILTGQSVLPLLLRFSIT